MTRPGCRQLWGGGRNIHTDHAFQPIFQQSPGPPPAARKVCFFIYEAFLQKGCLLSAGGLGLDRGRHKRAEAQSLAGDALCGKHEAQQTRGWTRSPSPGPEPHVVGTAELLGSVPCPVPLSLLSKKCCPYLGSHRCSPLPRRNVSTDPQRRRKQRPADTAQRPSTSRRVPSISGIRLAPWVLRPQNRHGIADCLLQGTHGDGRVRPLHPDGLGRAPASPGIPQTPHTQRPTHPVPLIFLPVPAPRRGCDGLVCPPARR